MHKQQIDTVITVGMLVNVRKAPYLAQKLPDDFLVSLILAPSKHEDMIGLIYCAASPNISLVVLQMLLSIR